MNITNEFINNNYKIDKKIYDKIEAEYLNENYIIESRGIYRLDNNGKRYYIRYNNDKVEYAPSATTVLDDQIPKKKYLEKWMIDNHLNYKNYLTEMKIKADYGTLLHIGFAELLQEKTIFLDDDSIKERIENYFKTTYDEYYLHKNNINILKWIKRFKKDIISIICFVKDYQIKPIAIEMPLIGVINENLIGGCVDLICKLKIEEKDKIALIDLKSTEKDYFSESNLIQLLIYKEIWNQNFPEYKIEQVYNLKMNLFKMKSLQKYILEEKNNFKPYKFVNYNNQDLDYYREKMKNIINYYYTENDIKIKDIIEIETNEININDNLKNIINVYNPLDIFKEDKETEKNIEKEDSF